MIELDRRSIRRQYDAFLAKAEAADARATQTANEAARQTWHFSAESWRQLASKLEPKLGIPENGALLH
jgi:hypothetical protein